MLTEYENVDDALKQYYDTMLKDRAAYMACQVDALPDCVQEGQILSRMDEVVRADLNQYQERTVYTYRVQRSE